MSEQTGRVSLRGRVVAVTGAGSELADGLADGLRGAGADVVRVVDVSTRETLEHGLVGVTRLDGLVHAHVEPAARVRRPLVGLDESDWERACESQVRAGLHACQAAQRRMPDGGRIVLVVPTVALTGSPGLVAWATAAEALRVLAKSAARRWGRQGITVNAVVPGLDAVAPELADVDVSLRTAALPGPADPARDVAPAVALLLADDAHHVTGTSVLVDGGVVMVP